MADRWLISCERVSQLDWMRFQLVCSPSKRLIEPIQTREVNSSKQLNLPDELVEKWRISRHLLIGHNHMQSKLEIYCFARREHATRWLRAECIFVRKWSIDLRHAKSESERMPTPFVRLSCPPRLLPPVDLADCNSCTSRAGERAERKRRGRRASLPIRWAAPAKSTGDERLSLMSGGGDAGSVPAKGKGGGRKIGSSRQLIGGFRTIGHSLLSRSAGQN